MPDTRVGSLDRPSLERYGKASCAVYQNSLGYYYLLEGCREKVHGSQLWTSTAHVKMRGSAPVGALREALREAPVGHAWDDDDEEARELAAAIAASLEDVGGPQQGWADVAPAGDDTGEEAGGDGDAGNTAGEGAGAGSAAGEGAAGNAGTSAVAGNSASRDCAICLSEPSVMIMKPCNHCCACTTCARRLVRRPCPMCRRMVTKVERIYF